MTFFRTYQEMIIVCLWHHPQRRQPIRDRKSVLLVSGTDELMVCVVFELGEERGRVESGEAVEVAGSWVG